MRESISLLSCWRSDFSVFWRKVEQLCCAIKDQKCRHSIVYFICFLPLGNLTEIIYSFCFMFLFFVYGAMHHGPELPWSRKIIVSFGWDLFCYSSSESSGNSDLMGRAFTKCTFQLVPVVFFSKPVVPEQS